MAFTKQSAPDQHKTLALAATALSVTGLAFSAYLAQHYFELRSGTAAFKSFCNFSSTLNCDGVAASPFAQVLPGLPIASLAGGWFIIWLLVIATSFFDFATQTSLKAMRILGVVGLAVSLIYLGIMQGIVGSLCPFCLGVDAVNLGLFGLGLWAAKLATQMGESKPAEVRQAQQRLGTLFVVGMLAGVVLLKMTDTSPKVSDGLVRDAIESTLAQTPKTIAEPSSGLVFGNPSGKIVIHEFSDMQCPHCKLGAQIMNTVIARHPDSVKVIYRAYPLDMSCNTKVEHAMHPFACDAARVVYCAQEQGRHKEVFETIFERQTEIASGKALEWAVELGLDKIKLENCLKAGSVNALVARDLAEGDQLGVGSTPTFFINGYRVEGALPPAVWEGLIEHLSK